MENNTHENAAKRVAIIGGGISGLATAYYLMKNLKPEDTIDITLYESTDRLGGNCLTYDVDLGGGPQRWADMGVNDFNRATYKKLNAIMIEADYTGNKLEDTELFYSDTLYYTNDAGNFTPMPEAVVHGFINFLFSAYDDFKSGKYNDKSLGDYVKAKNDDTPGKDFYPDAFVNNNLYPRVNAMYFCPGSPKDMPFAGVMSYYGLQEGYANANQTPDRCYFPEGTRLWIKKLLELLRKMATGNKKFQVKNPVKAIVDRDGPTPIVTENGVPVSYNTVVLAAPAYEALDCLGLKVGIRGSLSPVINMFLYKDDAAVVHTDASALATAVNAWRTYNVGIYQPGRQVPYTITYVANKHQNDADAGRPYGTPQFFIAMNPQAPINDKCVVKQTNGQTTQTSFRHQKLTLNTIAAQKKIDDLQNAANCNIWLVNGYAIGAGLHEECLTLAENIARRILGQQPTEQIFFDYTPGAKQVAPDYIANAYVPFTGDRKDMLKNFFAKPAGTENQAE